MNKVISIAFDGGTSSSKAIASFPENTSNSVFDDEKYFLIAPYIRQIREEHYRDLLEEKKEMGGGINLNDSLISFVDPKSDRMVYWHLGRSVARKGLLFLENRKFNSLLVKVLTFIGYLASKYYEREAIEINIGILLPLDEIDDREDLAKWLRQIVDCNGFRLDDKWFENVKINRLNIKPEGYGISKNSTSLNTGILSIGHNDMSWLSVSDARIERKFSKTFSSTGMHRFLDEFFNFNIEDEFLASKILSEAGNNCDRQVLIQLTYTKSEDELSRLIREVKKARLRYWGEREEDLRQLRMELIDEVYVGGGTAFYFQKEIKEFFKEYRVKVNWCKQLKREFCQRFDLKASSTIANLFLDCYGYFQFLNRTKSVVSMVEKPALEVIKSGTN